MHLILYMVMCMHSDEKEMALDDEQGRMFLRVLLQLAMTNHPPLVSKALKLLMRHFSQRKEVVDGFKQVLIVTYVLYTFVCTYL